MGEKTTWKDGSAQERAEGENQGNVIRMGGEVIPELQGKKGRTANQESTQGRGHLQPRGEEDHPRLENKDLSTKETTTGVKGIHGEQGKEGGKFTREWGGSQGLFRNFVENSPKRKEAMAPNKRLGGKKNGKPKGPVPRRHARGPSQKA